MIFKINKQKKKNYFYIVFLKFLLKSGDINKAKNIFKETFRILLKKKGLGIYSTLIEVYLKLHTNFEIRRVKIRRNSFLVPIPLTAKRKYYLICKWIFDAIKLNKSKIKMSSKLVIEILDIIQDQACESLSKKKMVETTVLENRSNAHYRWY